jgi:L-asparaginase / beta-aspartyl-peptidase
MRSQYSILLLAILTSLLGSCAHSTETNAGAQEAAASASEARWAIALHGGAGVIGKDMPAETIAAYKDSLRRALEAGRGALESGASALDVAELVVRQLEDDPRFNAGRGAVFTAEKVHELDASIMDGRQGACGAVTGVTTVRHPITLARRVMEQSRHVFFAGAGAESFADAHALERVDNAWFSTEKRRQQLRRAQVQGPRHADLRGTVGCVVLDQFGHLAAATSTGGMTNKRYGRIGDSPIIGAGTWADDATCAVSCTGSGEEFIRRGAAQAVASAMRYAGWSLERSADHVIHEVLAPGDGGLIAVSSQGEIAMPYSSKGMFRAAANSNGWQQVSIWED